MVATPSSHPASASTDAASAPVYRSASGAPSHASGFGFGREGPVGDALAAAQAGSDIAFAQLIRAHERSVYSVALRALGSSAEAEELAQDVFLQLYLDLPRLTSADHLGYWLRRTVSHRVIDRLRQRERRPSTRPLEPEECASLANGAFEPADPDPLLARRVAELLAELAAVPRLVLILRFQEDLDPLEIARVLDISVNTVKSHLKRALARLRAELGEEGS